MTLNPNIHPILWGNSEGFRRSLIRLVFLVCPVWFHICLVIKNVFHQHVFDARNYKPTSINQFRWKEIHAAKPFWHGMTPLVWSLLSWKIYLSQLIATATLWWLIKAWTHLSTHWIEIIFKAVGPEYLPSTYRVQAWVPTISLCGQWKVQCSEPEYWLCCSVSYYSTWLWIRLSIQSCGAIPQDLCRLLIFSLPIGGEITGQLFFWITLQFLPRDATEQM